MAKTTAQRQAAYRKRHKTTEKSRINSLVSSVAKLNLYRPAYLNGITQSEVLERLIKNEAIAQSSPVGTKPVTV